jgi:hypothetical protein
VIVICEATRKENGGEQATGDINSGGCMTQRHKDGWVICFTEEKMKEIILQKK